ncbi:amidohydrolase family protein [uncultured Erythrobacter sp.]|uniref:amidohydrolase family protein n=1 Tax=uncultured Erythrobacter sp. TaxID=263913 RepID=UPI002637B480|nr:amidohydrolase family protein [uncultured Erythrobacter sp.]
MHLKIITIAALLVLSSCSDREPSVVSTLPAPMPVDLVIENVTVIDPEQRSVSANRNVTINAGRIVAIEGDSRANALEPKHVVDGSGKFLIPGLMDMHVHTAVRPVTEDTFKLLIANGVTGVRDMSADCWEPRGELFLCIDEMRDYARRIEAGEITGPRLLRLSSAIVQSAPTWQLPEDPDPAYSPITAEQGRSIANSLHQRGVDLIKTYDRFHPDAYRAMLEEASLLGLEVSGHLPIFVSTAEASDLGQRSIEHARDILTDCSDFGPVYRSGNMAMLNGETEAGWPKQDDLRVQSVTGFNPERCDALLSKLANNATHYVPTHGTRELDFRADQDEYRNNPCMVLMSAFVLNDWQRDLDKTAGQNAERLPEYEAYYQHGLQLTKRAIDVDVPVMIGTDANDTMIIPGISLHEEMARFAEAGIEPMDILRAATSTPATYLDREDDFGGVSTGKIADLLLLSSNPLEDISATRDISAVIFGGELMDRTRLTSILRTLPSEQSEVDEAKKDRCLGLHE